MLIFLYGKDTFRSHKQLNDMITKFKKDRDPQGMNVTVIDCEKEVKNIIEQILAMPFLSEKRMVVLKNFLIGKNADTQTELIKYIKDKRIPETNVVIFWEGVETFKTKSAKTLLELLSQEKYCQKFDELKGVNLGQWIFSCVKERDGKINSDASQYLAQNSGGDMWLLNTLIDQLVDYVGEKEITLSDVQLFLNEKADNNIFNLVDALVQKQEKIVYKMIQEQYRIGEDVQFIFAMIMRQFKILLQMRDIFDRQDNVSSDVLAKQLGVHPFVAKKSLPLVRQYNMNELKKIYNELLDLDIKIKTGQGQAESLLDLFVARVCIH